MVPYFFGLARVYCTETG